MAQPCSTEKGNKSFLHLTYSIPGLRAQKDFAFHRSSTILTGAQLLRNVCKFGQGHVERLQDIQNLPGLFPNSIVVLAHQDPESEPVENNVSPWLQEGALDMTLVIVFTAGFFTNSINFNSKYLMVESFLFFVVFVFVFFLVLGEKFQAKKKRKGGDCIFFSIFFPLPCCKPRAESCCTGSLWQQLCFDLSKES